MSKTLDDLVSKLEESLEEKADSWFNSPRGWLSKPDFKRAAQDRSQIDLQQLERKGSASVGAQRRTSIFDSLSKLAVQAYKKRWFILDMNRKTLLYFRDDSMGEEQGSVPLSSVIDIQLSVLSDAPEFSIDLITNDKHFTIAADSHQQMVKWALALKLVTGVGAGNSKVKLTARSTAESQTGKSDVFTGDEKFTQFSYTFDPAGPLMLNVMGQANKDKSGNILSNKIIVTSFENFKDGKPGRAESSGIISVKDYVVGVNDVDLSILTFNDAMDAIGKASWPKTIHFLRDNAANYSSIKVEGWATVFYPALNRKRRRYIELKHDSVNFKKPAPGGSASAERDAYFLIRQIKTIRPVVDKTMPSDQQYILYIICKPDSFVDHVGENDDSIGGSPVEELVLYFVKDAQMQSWRSILASPSSDSPAEVLPIEFVDAAKSIATTDAANLAIRSEITLKFAPRFFFLSEGTLTWVRPPTNDSRKLSAKPRNLFIANSTACAVKSIIAYEDPNELRLSGYGFQVEIKTDKQTVTVGALDETTLLTWLSALKSVVATAPKLLTNNVIISNGIEKSRPPKDQLSNDDETLTAEDNLNSSHSTSTQANLSGDSPEIRGFLFKKEVSLGVASFQKRWFVLRGFNLYSYQSPTLSNNSTFELGNIDIRSAYEVREAQGVDAPENSIEILTTSKTHLFVAEDEDDHGLWLDALSDLLEARTLAVQKDAGGGGEKDSILTKVAQADAIKGAIVYSGLLHMKTIHRVTGALIWKHRYFAIVSGSLVCFEEEKDFFDQIKNANYEITLEAISKVETSTDSKCSAYGNAIDIHVDYFMKEGISSTLKVFTLDAKSSSLAYEWMAQLCQAKGTLTLKRNADSVGWYSSIDENAIKKRDDLRKASALKFGNASLVVKNSSGDNQGDDESTEGDPAKPVRRQSVLLAGGRGGLGRGDFGGRGGGTKRTNTVPVKEEEVVVADVGATIPPPASSQPTHISQLAGNQGRRPSLLAGRGRGAQRRTSSALEEIPDSTI